MKSHIETFRRAFGFAQLVVGVIRIPQEGNMSYLRHRLLEKLKTLGRGIVEQESDPGCVATRPGKTRGEPEADGVRAAEKHDRYCRCGLNRVRRHVAT